MTEPNSQSISEHRRVVLTKAVPSHGLEPGDVGTVVHVYPDGLAYEIEFTTFDGRTVALATVSVSDVRPVEADEITRTTKG